MSKGDSETMGEQLDFAQIQLRPLQIGAIVNLRTGPAGHYVLDVPRQHSQEKWLARCPRVQSALPVLVFGNLSEVRC